MKNQIIAVLCAHKKTAYLAMEDIEIYDSDRDARSFPGGMPVIAHPPCRAWSAFCSHQAKPAPGEQELGLWCAEQVRKWGGILEQPAHSRLWKAAGLPYPGASEGPLSWSMAIWQSWWGYPQKKATWLYFSGIQISDVSCPLRLTRPAESRRAEQCMSRRQRSATSLPLATWLVNIARKSTGGVEEKARVAQACK